MWLDRLTNKAEGHGFKNREQSLLSVHQISTSQVSIMHHQHTQWPFHFSKPTFWPFLGAGCLPCFNTGKCSQFMGIARPSATIFWIISSAKGPLMHHNVSISSACTHSTSQEGSTACSLHKVRPSTFTHEWLDTEKQGQEVQP